jgi:hypothetical protein
MAESASAIKLSSDRDRDLATATPMLADRATVV